MPQVLTHGLVASGGVFLRVERCQILRYVCQILAAGVDGTNTQLLNYDRPDASDLAYREQVGRRVDSLLRYYATHPQPGERNHKRTLKILRLYCQGLTEQEISDKLKISQQAVNQSLARSIERLKVVAKRL